MASPYENHLQQVMHNNSVPNTAGKDHKAVYQFGSLQVPTASSSPSFLGDGINGNYAQNYVDPGYYPTNDFYGYFYPGYDGLPWNAQTYFSGFDGLNIQYPVAQADNSQFVYYNPWYQHGYDALASVAPGTVVGIDGQIVANQPPYTGTAFQQPSSHLVHYPSPAYGTNFFSPNTVDAAPLGVKSTDRSRLTEGVRPLSKSNQSFTHPTASVKAAASRFSNFSDKEDRRYFNASRNQPIKSEKAAQHNTTLPYIPIARYPDKASVRYYNATDNTRRSELFGSERLRGRSKVNGSSYDSIYEQNRGPRFTGQKILQPSNIDSTGQGDASKMTSTIREGQYNLPEFQTAYERARFYVIKSYSEDDIHKSVKYGVWCSTAKGNRKLDLAYQAAQKKVEEKGSECPVFLFFSVNASGHFCGVAEMTSRVDFEKNMDFWLQDKWTGFFPVKWHIIKDVPHTQFRHIRLDNNDYQPVTSSRDTQEVKLEQGIEMLNIFKNYAAKTSIRDDFGFYDDREKLLHDVKILPPDGSSTNVGKYVDERQVTEVGNVKIVLPADENVSAGKDVLLNDTNKDVGNSANEEVSESKDVELNDTNKDVGNSANEEVSVSNEEVSVSKDVELNVTNKDVGNSANEEVSVSKDVGDGLEVAKVGDVKTNPSPPDSVRENVELNVRAKDVDDAKNVELNVRAKDVDDAKNVELNDRAKVELNDTAKDVGDAKTISSDEVSSVSEDVKLNDIAKDAGDTCRVAEHGDVDTDLNNPAAEIVSVSKDVELKHTAND